MKRLSTLFLLWVLGVAGTLGATLHAAENTASTSALNLTAPVITSIQRETNTVVVTVEVPEGLRRVTLEGRDHLGAGAWQPLGIARLTGKAATVTFRLAISAPVEMLRVKADATDPLPAAFYQGNSRFGQEVTAAEVNYAENSFNNPRNVATGDSAGPVATTPNRAVEESDIWKLHGDTLYFFNQLRGLQVIDVTNPDAAEVRGTLSLPASGEQMYVLGDDHVILLAQDNCAGWNSQSSSRAIIVRIAEGQPYVRHTLPVHGHITESRLVGTALYVASQTYRVITNSVSGGITQTTWEYGLELAAFDLSNPELPVTRNQLWFPGYGAVNTATDEYFFVAASNLDTSGTSTLNIVDITSPDGTMVAAGVVKPRGQLKDKFKIHQYNDVLVTIAEDRRWSNGNSLTSWLETFSLANPNAPQKLAQLEVGRNETLFATRFDGDRAYIVTFLRIDPLWIVDLADPAAPRISGELEIPGWSTYIQPLGDRLVTVGIDDANSWRVAVSLFDVADASAPALLSKVPLGDNYSWSEANHDEKAFTVLPDSGLILLPISTYYTNQQQGIQIIELERDQLTKRGLIEHVAQARRATTHRDRILSLSSQELLSVDIADLDAPAVKNELELAWTVDRVFAVGDYLVEIEGQYNPYSYSPWLTLMPYYQAQPSTTVRIVSQEQPDHVLNILTFTNYSLLGAEERDGRLYLLQQQATSNYWSVEPKLSRLSVLDLTQLPALSVLSQTELSTNLSNSGNLSAVWPKTNLLVWSSGNSQPYYWPMLSVIDTIDTALVGAAIDSFWYPYYYGGDRSFAAFDVSDPAAPEFASLVTLTNRGWDVSKALAVNGLVYQSTETHKSEITSTNYHVYTNIIQHTITNIATVTNVIQHPYFDYETIVVTRTNVTYEPSIGLITNIITETNLVYFTRNDLNATGQPKTVSAGLWFTGVLLTDGKVWAWGQNLFGQGGTGDYSDTTPPGVVTNLSEVKLLVSGGRHSMALKRDGQLWGWGANWYGQLGDQPTITNDQPPFPLFASAVPVQAGNASDWTQVAAGTDHTLGVRTDGSLWAWGANGFGQLGTGNRIDRHWPVSLDTTNIQRVAAGHSHSLALTKTGQVLAWGDNSAGQLGVPGLTSHLTPTPVPLLDNIRNISAGVSHSLALQADGQVLAWGNNTYGQLGHDDGTTDFHARIIPGLSNIVYVTAGSHHSMAIDSEGRLWTWGANDAGQLGDGTVQSRHTPKIVENISYPLFVAGGMAHSVVAQSDGSVLAWGSNQAGQLGDGLTTTFTNLLSLTNIAYITNLTAITNVVTETNIVLVIRYETVTNILTRTNYTFTNEYVLQTNAIPIYRYYRVHSLDVVDYLDAASPLVRKAIDIPGRLIGLSHEGSLLYTEETRKAADEPQYKLWVEASAYDGLAAYLVDALSISNYANTKVLVDNANVFLALPNSGNVTSPVIESWRLSEAGQFEKLGSRSLLGPAQSFGAFDGLLAVRYLDSVELYDALQPETMPHLGSGWLSGCAGVNFDLADGSRATGLWIPLSDYGVVGIPLFPEVTPTADDN